MFLSDRELSQLKITGAVIATGAITAAELSVRYADLGYGVACEICDTLTSPKARAEYRRYWILASTLVLLAWDVLVLAGMVAQRAIARFVAACENPAPTIQPEVSVIPLAALPPARLRRTNQVQPLETCRTIVPAAPTAPASDKKRPGRPRKNTKPQTAQPATRTRRKTAQTLQGVAQ
jgi:hypothetical protein